MALGRVLSILCALSAISPLIAEGEAPPPVNGSAQPQGKSLNRTINVFDDSVFQLSGDKALRESNSGRTLGEDAEYNTEQRERWLKKCAPLRERDLRKYQDCYKKEKQAELDNVRRGIADQESKQAEPLRNTGPGKEAPAAPPLLPDVDERESTDEE